MFGRKATIDEQTKASNRALRNDERALIRDRQKLDTEENRLKNELRKAANTQNKASVNILAKQIVQIRNQKARLMQASGQIQGLAAQNRMMGSNVRIAEAMQRTAATAARMNQIVDPGKMNRTAQQFTQAQMQFSIAGDMINETFDNALGDVDEEEEDAIVNEVLDSIGIANRERINQAPSVPNSRNAGRVAKIDDESDAELERMLAQLRA